MELNYGVTCVRGIYSGTVEADDADTLKDSIEGEHAAVHGRCFPSVTIWEN